MQVAPAVVYSYTHSGGKRDGEVKTGLFWFGRFLFHGFVLVALEKAGAGHGYGFHLAMPQLAFFGLVPQGRF